MDITTNQQRVLAFLREHLAREGYPPSVREVQRALGFASPNAAAKHLRALESADLIERSGHARGIRLRDAAPATLTLPLIGKVAAGAPILATAHVERHVGVDLALFRRAPDYLLRVRGDSMHDAGIFDGDLIAVARASTARSGEIVIARIDDEVTIKVFERNGQGLRLLPRNKAHAPIVVDATREFAIEGLYCGLLRVA